ncbi:(d)CMP kinase [Robiginitalea sp.]|nr:(d)CMP kinase [Robiginitalea sp.]
MRKIAIAIDGHSSTGKSTLARQLAQELGYVYIDSGAMYRAVTLYALENELLNEVLDVEALLLALPQLDIRFGLNLDTGRSEVLLNGKSVEGKIRGMDVSSQVSKVAALGPVREKLVALQRAMGKDGGVVMDGRDIGTVVMPNAELKIFMTATAEIRASRRYKELLDKGDNTSYDEVLRNVRERDHLDSTREISPLLKAKDAVELDNSDMGKTEQFDRIITLAKDRIEKNI